MSFLFRFRLLELDNNIMSIKGIIAGLKDDYEEAKAFFLEIYHDAQSMYNWVEDELYSIKHRTQSMEILLVNKTKNTILEFLTDDGDEVYFRTGGGFFPSKGLTTEMMSLKPCSDRKNIQVLEHHFKNVFF